MVMMLVIVIGMAATAYTKDSAWVAFSALLVVAWHELILWDIHNHIARIEADRNA